LVKQYYTFKIQDKEENENEYHVLTEEIVNAVLWLHKKKLLSESFIERLRQEKEKRENVKK